MKNKLLMVFLLAFVVYGCQTETLDTPQLDTENTVEENLDVSLLNNKDYIQTATLNEKLAYKEFHLSNIMEQVLEINPYFEELEEVKSAKGQNPTFYLENLLATSLRKKNLPVSTLKSDGSTSVGAFENLEGESWYPILKRIKKGNGNSKEAVYLMNSYDEKSGIEFVKAYKAENGELKLLHENFTEEMFLNNTQSNKEFSDVYSLAIASTSSTQIIAEFDNDGGGGGGGGGGGTTSSYKIEYMKIKDKKESWLEKADIKKAGTVVPFISPNVFYDCTTGGCAGGDGILIRKYSQKEVKQKKNIRVNNTLVARNVSGFYNYVIFEHDNWPAPEKFEPRRAPNGATLNVTYRSYNDLYHREVVALSGNTLGFPRISGLRIDNNAIEYNIR